MKINLRKVLRYICLFFIFLYPFNSTIASKIYQPMSLLYVTLLLSMAILTIISMKQKMNKRFLVILFVIIVIAAITLVNNHYFINGNKNKPILFIIYLFLPLILQLDKENLKASYQVIKLFGFEHIAATLCAGLLPSFYQANILPFLDSIPQEILPSSQYYRGVNFGITTHYSTNGMYLSIIAILLFTEFLNKKSKKNMIFMAVAFIALLMIGKRAHAIFTVIACLIEYLFLNRAKITKKVISIVACICIAIVGLQVVSIYIPQVLTVMNRITGIAEGEGTVLSGREEFYELALRLWDEHKLLGNGWGAFSSYYQIYLVNTFGYSYLDGHNVYLQLLCETGIIGLALFVTLFIYFIVTSYRECKQQEVLDSEKKVLYFTFAYQVFFLLYSLTGNPLYDPQCYVVYFTCIGCTLAYLKLTRRNKDEQKSDAYNISKCL